MAVASAATRRQAKVLSQAGFGNGGSVPDTNPDSRTASSDAAASARGAECGRRTRGSARWREPRRGGGRDLIKAERYSHGRAARRTSGDADATEAGLRGVVAGLSDGALSSLTTTPRNGPRPRRRPCCPRDLGAPAAAAIRGWRARHYGPH